MNSRMALALASVVALFLSAPSQALAQGTTKIDLEGPGTVYEGEQAVFYSRDNEKAKTWSDLECVATDSNGKQSRFTGEMAFTPGTYKVQVTSPGFVSPTISLHVKALPPPISPNAPLAQRLVNIQLCVWDGDHSFGGRFVEGLGRFLGPKVIGAKYAFTWAMAGRQASRANVDYAIAEMARRGYTIDMYSAVHGYPIELGDGSEWTHPGSNPAIKAIRMFYTTACYGADGSDEFLAAGVKTYVAAKGLNFINVFHAMIFSHKLGAGEDVAQANTESIDWIEKVTHLPLVNKLARVLQQKFAEGDGTKAGFDRDLDASKPIVFGNTKMTFKTDPGPTGLATAVVTPKPKAEAGIVQALGSFAAP